MKSPYSSLPDAAHWKRSVSGVFREELLNDVVPYLRCDDRVVSLGSCFAANIVPFLESSGIHYVRTEAAPPFVVGLERRFNYNSYSAGYGNIYTVRQALQLVLRASGKFASACEPWIDERGYVDPYRPGLEFVAETRDEYDEIIASHLACVRQAFEEATVLVLTLGLIEAWIVKETGAVLPACPGTVAGDFEPELYEFAQFGYEDVLADLEDFRCAVLSLNPQIRFLVTVSPVPLSATATTDHVLIANSMSKSVLRCAAGKFESLHEDVRYVPALELVTGPQAGGAYFEDDKRTVSAEGVAAVMRHFLHGIESRNGPISAHRKSIAEQECEEEIQANGF